jgi:Secretion system C-terminal sorting domain
MGRFITGQNTPTLTLKWKVANAQESIDCYVYRNNCFDSTDVNIIVSHAVGMNTSSVNKIKVYPNPVSDVLTFDIKNNLEHANISIYNTLGQMLQQSTLHNNELIVTGLPEGVYQFVLSKGTQHFRGTFIKE